MDRWWDDSFLQSEKCISADRLGSKSCGNNTPRHPSVQIPFFSPLGGLNEILKETTTNLISSSHKGQQNQMEISSNQAITPEQHSRTLANLQQGLNFFPCVREFVH
jgi:hypothetical protein